MRRKKAPPILPQGEGNVEDVSEEFFEGLCKPQVILNKDLQFKSATPMQPNRNTKVWFKKNNLLIKIFFQFAFFNLLNAFYHINCI